MGDAGAAPPPGLRRTAEEREGAAVLDDLHRRLVRYVAMPSEAAEHAVTLWIAATHGQVSFEHAPRLAVLSPEKRCGKSRLLDICFETCHDVISTTNATVAAVVRSIGINKEPPTLLVDEADALFGTRKASENNEDLRALLNAGHQRNRFVLRCVGPNQVPQQFPTFAMAALAGIGDLPDTIMDRSIVVRMRRRAAGEYVAPFRSRRDGPPLREVRDRLKKWVTSNEAALAAAEPEMPLEDRAADTWEPLVAIADLAGGPWPERARAAALVLVAGQEDDDANATLRRRLLSDLRDQFADVTADQLPSETIVRCLWELPEAPWRSLDESGLNPRSLARLLKPYEVKSKPFRSGATTLRGYSRAALRDVWERYLPPLSAADEPEPDETQP